MAENLPDTPKRTISPDELQELEVFINRLADAAADIIRPHFRTGLDVDNKGDGQGGRDHFDPVTLADRAGEDVIRAMIEEAYPNHGIYGEERGIKPSTDGLTWVIDPIDGTRAFITGMPLWGILIGLYDGEKAVMGVMDQPFTRERFFGCNSVAKVTRDGTEIALRTSGKTDLSASLKYTTHPDMFAPGPEHDAYQSLAAQVNLVRFGGDCYAYAMLAHGLVDLVVESSLKPYDIVALIPIIEAAGGVITNWAGGPAHNAGQIIAAATPELHAQAIALLKQGAHR